MPASEQSGKNCRRTYGKYGKQEPIRCRSIHDGRQSCEGWERDNYLDLLQNRMLSVPNANEDQINAFRAYIERQVAANQAFVSKLLRAKDIQEAMQIQVEYFQSQMRTFANDAMQLTDKMAASAKRSAG
jgi:hypothetical protein